MKSHNHDLDWLAFRYIADELSPDEAASFETLLAGDQAACDAVVRAVELSQTIVAAQVQSARPQPISAQRHWTAPLMLIACGTAACLLIALSLNFSSHSPNRSTVSDELVTAWNQQLEQSSDGPTLEEPSDADEAEFVTAEAPSWMLDAVRSLNGLEPSDDEESNSSETMEG
jgi:hypothetical protein